MQPRPKVPAVAVACVAAIMWALLLLVLMFGGRSASSRSSTSPHRPSTSSFLINPLLTASAGDAQAQCVGSLDALVGAFVVGSVQQHKLSCKDVDSGLEMWAGHPPRTATQPHIVPAWRALLSHEQDSPSGEGAGCRRRPEAAPPQLVCLQRFSRSGGYSGGSVGDVTAELSGQRSLWNWVSHRAAAWAGTSFLLLSDSLELLELVQQQAAEAEAGAEHLTVDLHGLLCPEPQLREELGAGGSKPASAASALAPAPSTSSRLGSPRATPPATAAAATSAAAASPRCLSQEAVRQRLQSCSQLVYDANPPSAQGRHVPLYPLASTATPHLWGGHVSVLVPAIPANIAHDLPRLIASTKAQTHQPAEIIIVLSGSSEAECERVQGMSYLGARLRVVCEEELLLQAEARNVAMGLASSDIVSLMDADDVMHPQRLEVVVEAFMSYPGLSLLAHGFSDESVDSGRTVLTLHGARKVYGDELSRIAQVSQAHRAWILAEMQHAHVSLRRSVALSVRFDESLLHYRYEDSLFVRSVLEEICGRTEHERLSLRCANGAMFVDLPLSVYLPAGA